MTRILLDKDELTPEWQDVRKVSEIARSTVVIAMERNIDIIITKSLRIFIV